jgi:glycosyltransferase involved in cell wall biosynthesis
MKISLLTTSFPRYRNDIAGNFVLGFTRALVAVGYEFDVLVPEPARGTSPPSWDKITVHWIPYMRPRVLSRTFYGAGVLDNLEHSLSAWIGLAPFTVALAHAVRRNLSKWDAIISHWALPCAVVAGAFRNALPHVAVLHSADLHLLRRLPARGLLAQQIATNARKLLFVSPVLRDEFVSWLPGDKQLETQATSSVFPMGIEPIQQVDRDREQLRRGFGFDRFTLLSISRLVPVKGVDCAIEALANRDDIIVAVVGEGPERAALERLARRYSAPVRFLGKVTGSGKHELLRSVDAFICPSRVLSSGRTEGVPTTILEAMAHALPIIASDVGGISRVVDPMHSGLLVPPCDPIAFRRAVDLLIDDSALRAKLGRAAQKVARRYTWPNLIDQLAPLIDSAITA